MKKNTRKNVARGKVFSNETIAQKINLMSLGGGSHQPPPILYEFNFGSFTNISLRKIERELTDVKKHTIIKDLNSKRSKVSMFYSTKVPES